MRMPALFDGQRYPTWWETAVSAVAGAVLMWIGGEAFVAVLQGLFVGVLGIVAFKFTQHRQQFVLAFSSREHHKTLSPVSTEKEAKKTPWADKANTPETSDASANSGGSPGQRETLPLSAAAAPAASPTQNAAATPTLPVHNTRLPSAADMKAFGEALGALRFRAEHTPQQPRETTGRVAAAVSNGAALELVNKVSTHEEDDHWKRPLLNTQASAQFAEPTGQRAAELKRSILRLLNRACPENVGTIVEQLADIQLDNSSELGFVIKTLFKRALADPHYCETYADLTFGLYTVSSEPPAGAGEGTARVPFASLVVTVCRSEFEALRTSFKATTEESAGCEPEDVEFELKKRKEKMLAMMSLMGNLFLRGLVTSCLIGGVLTDLIGEQEHGAVPEEQELECACEVLRSVGATLQADPASEPIVAKAFRRLTDLKSAKTASGKAAYCKRLQFAVQDLVDLRSAGWVKKVFKSSAKTKDEIRYEAANEEELKHQGEDGVQMAVAGQRPQTIAGVKVKWGEAEGVGQAPPTENSPSTATQSTKDWPKSYDRTSVVVQLPWGLAGKVIGPRGETARVLQEETGTRVWVDRQASQARISGTPEAVAVAERAITALVAAGGVEGLASGDDETCTSSTRSSSSLAESESSEWSRSRSEKSWHSHESNRMGARKRGVK